MDKPPPEDREQCRSEIVEAERLTCGAGEREFAPTQEIMRFGGVHAACQFDKVVS